MPFNCLLVTMCSVTANRPAWSVWLEWTDDFYAVDVPSSSSDVGPMEYPRSLAVTKHGDILVADTNNHRILAINSSLTCAEEFPLPADVGLRLPWCRPATTMDRLVPGRHTWSTLYRWNGRDASCNRTKCSRPLHFLATLTCRLFSERWSSGASIPIPMATNAT